MFIETTNKYLHVFGTMKILLIYVLSYLYNNNTPNKSSLTESTNIRKSHIKSEVAPTLAINSCVQSFNTRVYLQWVDVGDKLFKRMISN